MDILTFSSHLESQLKAELDKLQTGDGEIIRIGRTIMHIREAIAKLKTFTYAYSFISETEEIKFFKEVKPVFLKQFHYYKKLFALILFDSFKDEKARRSKHDKMLRQQERFAQKNLDFFEYCMSGSTLFDSRYFTRGKTNLISPDRDDRFSTGYDTKLSKILANELLKNYLLEANQISSESKSPEAQGLMWTGPKTDLIELIYALQSAEVFNRGNANIKVIASFFESHFNIQLGDYYRTFVDMRIRKKSQASFLDTLRSKFLERVSDFK